MLLFLWRTESGFCHYWGCVSKHRLSFFSKSNVWASVILDWELKSTLLACTIWICRAILHVVRKKRTLRTSYVASVPEWYYFYGDFSSFVQSKRETSSGYTRHVDNLSRLQLIVTTNYRYYFIWTYCSHCLTSQTQSRLTTREKNIWIHSNMHVHVMGIPVTTYLNLSNLEIIVTCLHIRWPASNQLKWSTSTIDFSFTYNKPACTDHYTACNLEVVLSVSCIVAYQPPTSSWYCRPCVEYKGIVGRPASQNSKHCVNCRMQSRDLMI